MKSQKKSEFFSENAKGWTKEINMVSWNEHDPKYDIREWAPDHSRMGKRRYINSRRACFS